MSASTRNSCWLVRWLSLTVAVSRTACEAPGDQPPRPVAADMPAARLISTTIGRIAVRDFGQGPQTLVLWPSILADHSIYAEQIRAWRTQYRLVVIDGPGHGDSGAPAAPFTMAQCAQALAEVLDALGEQRPVVVLGTSWGGLVAGEFAIAYPARTAGVVMLNTPVLNEEAGPSFADRFVVWGARWIHGMQLYSDGVARAFFLPETRERGGPLLDRFHAHLHRADGYALSVAVRSVLIDRAPLAPRMDRIAAPTLFVAGTQDTMYPVATLRDAAAKLPRGTFVELPTRHISVVDAPAATTMAVDEFLQTLKR